MSKATTSRQNWANKIELTWEKMPYSSARNGELTPLFISPDLFDIIAPPATGSAIPFY